MKNIIKYSALLVTLLILSGCVTGTASGPSALASKSKIKLEQEEKETRKKNTDILVKHFISQVWTKTPKELFQAANKSGDIAYKFNKMSDSERLKSKGNYYKITNPYTPGKVCNPDPNPPLTLFLKKEPTKDKKAYLITAIYGYDFKKKYNKYKYDPKTKRNVLNEAAKCLRGEKYKADPLIFRSPGVAWTTYYAETLNATDFLDELINKGLVVDKEAHCTKSEYPIKGGNLSETGYRCSLDIADDIKNVQRNFAIMTYGYNFMQFMLSELRITNKDENTPLGLIYAKRYKSQKYKDTVAQFHIVMNQHLKIRIEKNEAKRRQETIEYNKMIAEGRARRAERRAEERRRRGEPEEEEESVAEYQERLRRKFQALEEADGGGSTAVMDGLNQFKKNANDILNQRQQNFNRKYKKNSRTNSRKRSTRSRYSNNKPIYSPRSRNVKKPSGPVVTCPVSHNKTMGSLAQGQYCYLDAQNGNSKSCSDFLTRGLVWSNRNTHCFQLAKKMSESEGRVYAGGKLSFDSISINSCVCGVNKYSSPMCKMIYTINCKKSSVGGGKGRSK